MTDFVNLPLDPFQRTTTTFRPYKTEAPSKGSPTVAPPTTPGGPSGQGGRGWMGPVGVAAAVALVVGAGFLVNDARSEPAVPNVEVQAEVDGPTGPALVQNEIDNALAEAQTQTNAPTGPALVQNEIDKALAEAQTAQSDTTSNGYVGKAAIEHSQSDTTSNGYIGKAAIEHSQSTDTGTDSGGLGYLDKAAIVRS